MHKKTILVTGAKGFIGSNLIKRFQNLNNINIIEFNRNSSLKTLEEQIGSVDFIFHFAGEVKPKSSDNDFEQSNAILTKSIIEIIEKKGKKIPFLMTSSIHAELEKNAYGKTKREAEVYLEEYGKHNDTSIWIYRLPHVFGEGCKANYNSVISTWIYNSILNEEIVVFDRAIPMTYVYVQDFIDEALKHLVNDKSYGFCEVSAKHQTTLGEVVDYINEFHNKIDDKSYSIANNDFKQKLFNTYKDYYKAMNI